MKAHQSQPQARKAPRKIKVKSKNIEAINS